MKKKDNTNYHLFWWDKIIYPCRNHWKLTKWKIYGSRKENRLNFRCLKIYQNFKARNLSSRLQLNPLLNKLKVVHLSRTEKSSNYLITIIPCTNKNSTIWTVGKSKCSDVQISVSMIEIVKAEAEVDQIKQVNIYLFRALANWSETDFIPRRKSLIRVKRNVKGKKKIRSS